MAGEIGHDIVDEAGPFCRCGTRGCLEAVAGGAAITEVLSRIRRQVVTLPQALDLAEDGDPTARRVLAQVGRQIGVAAAKLCNVVNPERIVIGGLLARAGDLLLDPMRESVRQYAVDSAKEVLIVPSVFGERAGVLGGLGAGVVEGNTGIRTAFTCFDAGGVRMNCTSGGGVIGPAAFRGLRRK